MDTIGWSSLSNYDKTYDLWFGYAISAAGFLLQYFLYRKYRQSVGINTKLFTLTTVLVGIGMLWASVTSVERIILVGAFFLSSAFVDRKWQEAFVERKMMILVIALSCLFVLFRSESILISISILVAYFVFFWRAPLTLQLIFLLAVVIRFPVPTVTDLSDPFHISESFTSVIGISRHNVFPNLGLFEQMPALLAWDFLDRITFGLVDPTILGVRVSVAVFFFAFIISRLSRRDPLIAVFVCFLMPIDRINTLFAISLAFLLLEKNGPDIRLKALAAMALPTVCLMLSLNSAAFFLLTGPALLMLALRARWQWTAAVIFAWLLQLGLFWRQFLDYFAVYLSFAKVNLLAHGLPLFRIPDVQIALKVTLLFVFGVLCAVLIEKFRRVYRFGPVWLGYAISFICVFAFYYINANYALGRIDPGPSRIFNMVALFVPIVGYVAIVPRYAIALLVIVGAVFWAPWISGPPSAGVSSNFSLRQDFIKLTPEMQQRLDMLRRFDDTHDGTLILFADPALAPFGDFLLPPFTTPWVTVGEVAQERNIEYFEQNKDMPIYLSSTGWVTFDGVDIRARSPEVFRYLAANYRFLRFGDAFFAIPDRKKPSKILFSDFNLQRSGAYFAKWGRAGEDYIEITRDDDLCASEPTRRAKIVGESNYFYIEAECGLNKIPAIYLIGHDYKVEW